MTTACEAMHAGRVKSVDLQLWVMAESETEVGVLPWGNVPFSQGRARNASRYTPLLFDGPTC